MTSEAREFSLVRTEFSLVRTEVQGILDEVQNVARNALEGTSTRGSRPSNAHCQCHERGSQCQRGVQSWEHPCRRFSAVKWPKIDFCHFLGLVGEQFDKGSRDWVVLRPRDVVLGGDCDTSSGPYESESGRELLKVQL